MKNTPIFERIRTRPYRFVFLTLLTAVLLHALAPALVGTMYMGDIVMVVLICIALVAAARNRENLVVAGVLGIPAVVLRLVTSARPDSPGMNSAILVLSSLFFLYLIWVIVGDIYAGRRHTSERIFGALCAYIFIGVVFALLYAHLEFRDPGADAFNVSNDVILENVSSEVSLLPVFTYYSFVTLTTLGYGDITPVSEAARTLAWLEALIGQLYLAVMVAGFVALHMSEKRREELDREQGDPQGRVR